MFKFFRHGFSLDEFKVSTLVIGFLAVLVSSIFGYFMFGDITDNFLSLAETLIYAIAGVNAVNGVATIVDRTKTKNKNVDVEIVEEANESPNEEFKI
jgi:uncharacterized membrane protein HdeD (DUF308 family)